MINVIWHKEPVIETERLILRPLTVADAEAVLEWAGGQPCKQIYGIYRV